MIRIQKRKKNETGKLSYLVRLLLFVIKSFFEVSLEEQPLAL